MSSPEYLGMASVLKIDMIDRWENPEHSVFSSFYDRCSGFQVADPEFSVLSTSRIQKMRVLVVGPGTNIKYMHIMCIWFAPQLLGNWPHRDQFPLPYFFFNKREK